MSEFHNPAFDKIVNPDLAYRALHADKTFGEFGVIIKFVRPDIRHPSYMKVTGQYSPGHIRARVPCNKIRSVIGDRNVLSVELREHVTQ